MALCGTLSGRTSVLFFKREFIPGANRRQAPLFSSADFACLESEAGFTQASAEQQLFL
jgi:hypothetical protein